MNVLGFGLIEEVVVKRMRDKLIRVSIVVVAIVAWLSISNHCVVAAVVSTNTQSSEMHCHGPQPSPAEKDGGKQMQCCKVLRATIPGTIDVPSHQQTGVQDFVTPELFSIAEDHLQPLPEEIDTGPPFASSYAELILQRSILVHAPPFIV